MKKALRIIFVMMAALAIAAVAGCSKDNEPNEEGIPEYKGWSLIQAHPSSVLVIRRV